MKQDYKKFSLFIDWKELFFPSLDTFDFVNLLFIIYGTLLFYYFFAYYRKLSGSIVFMSHESWVNFWTEILKEVLDNCNKVK